MPVVDADSTYSKTFTFPKEWTDGTTTWDLLDFTIDAFATQYNWSETIDDPENPGEQIPNPETKEQHFERKFRDYIFNIVKAHILKVTDETRLQYLALASEMGNDLKSSIDWS